MGIRMDADSIKDKSLSELSHILSPQEFIKEQTRRVWDSPCARYLGLSQECCEQRMFGNYKCARRYSDMLVKLVEENKNCFSDKQIELAYKEYDSSHKDESIPDSDNA